MSRNIERKCGLCSTSIAGRNGNTLYCVPCASKKNKGLLPPYNSVARTILSSAINNGFMPKAAALRCVDCGKKAMDYDHRDYNKPLDVVPVCRGCNKKRGAGIPLMKLYDI